MVSLRQAVRRFLCGVFIVTVLFPPVVCADDHAPQYLPMQVITIQRADGIMFGMKVEIADDETERSKGLMYRTDLPEGQGMLFLYKEPLLASFWMKNTLVPLDILFVRDDGTIVQIEENVPAHSLEPRDAKTPVLAVLEVEGGEVARLGLSVGDKIVNPPIFRHRR